MSQEVVEAAHRLADESRGISGRSVAVILNHFLSARVPVTEWKTHYPVYERIGGVYALFNGNEVVYVGQSRDLHGRIRTHRGANPDQPAIKPITHAGFLSIEVADTLLLEYRLIKTLAPRGNGKAAKPSRSWSGVRLDLLSDLLNIPYEELYQIVQNAGVSRTSCIFNLQEALAAYGQSKKISLEC